jgi:hypothetical protein
MQSNDSKTKRPQKSAEEAKPVQASQPLTAGEEAAQPRRKAPAAKKAVVETTSAAKQHRGSAKKTAVAASVPETLQAPLAAPSAGGSVTHEQIASLAYSYWQDRGFQGGSPEEDWHRAERELKSR